jgi:hypothetical protein
MAVVVAALHTEVSGYIQFDTAAFLKQMYVHSNLK